MVYSLEITTDRLHIADIYGQISQLNYDQTAEIQIIWQQKTTGYRTWFLQSDDYAIYQGHNSGVSAYAIASGKMLWHYPSAEILCGLLLEDSVIVGASDRYLYQLQKSGDIKAKTNEAKVWAECEGAVYSCTLARDGQLILVADHQEYIYAFTRSGERLGKYPTGCGAILTMRCFGDRIYGTTNAGTMACFEIEQFLQVANSVPPKPPEPPAVVATTVLNSAPTLRTQTAIVECVKVGSKLKVRAISEGYHSDWSVQFPTKLRELGARYRVEELREVPDKSFYRVCGKIEKIE